MKAKELERRVNGAIKMVKENINDYDAEPVNIWCGRKLSSAQFYGAVSMKTMEDNLADLGNGCRIGHHKARNKRMEGQCGIHVRICALHELESMGTQRPRQLQLGAFLFHLVRVCPRPHVRLL